jgi:NitT/TauT family transport system permease protein
MSFIIIAIIWFASSMVPVFVGFLMCFPIIFTNVYEGVKNVDNKLLEMSKVYNIKKLRVVRNIYIPSLIPYILAGMTTALGIGWKATVAAEVLSHPKYAIGTHLYDAKVYLESAELFAWTIVVIGLSFIFEYVIKMLFRKKIKERTSKGI